jgi:carboxy-cis,cis-muconate cyclase
LFLVLVNRNAMETAQDIFSTSNTTANHVPIIHHILSGSFRSLSLFLLAFSPLHRTLSLVQTVDAFGPHQYLALNTRKDRAYTTSWALPPTLSSWEIERPESGDWHVNHVNSVPISTYEIFSSTHGVINTFTQRRRHRT